MTVIPVLEKLSNKYQEYSKRDRIRGIDKGLLEKTDIHVHVPEGATPKDGPSAGISMATAIHSLALKKSVKKDLAMTGELTLTGQVLPVGGIREKLVGARLGGIKQIILPRANKPQYEELPDYIKKDIQIEFVERYAEVSNIALGIEPEEK